MLSIVGSIQPDPFSASHVPYQPTSKKTTTQQPTLSISRGGLEGNESGDEDFDFDEDLDTLPLLKRKAEAAAEKENGHDTPKKPSKPSKKKKRKTGEKSEKK